METDVRVEVFLKHKYQFEYIQSFHYMKTIKHMMIRDSCAVLFKLPDRILLDFILKLSTHNSRHCPEDERTIPHHQPDPHVISSALVSLVLVNPLSPIERWDSS